MCLLSAGLVGPRGVAPTAWPACPHHLGGLGPALPILHCLLAFGGFSYSGPPRLGPASLGSVHSCYFRRAVGQSGRGDLWGECTQQTFSFSSFLSCLHSRFLFVYLSATGPLFLFLNRNLLFWGQGQVPFKSPPCLFLFDLGWIKLGG